MEVRNNRQQNKFFLLAHGVLDLAMPGANSLSPLRLPLLTGKGNKSHKIQLPAFQDKRPNWVPRVLLWETEAKLDHKDSRPSVARSHNPVDHVQITERDWKKKSDIDIYVAIIQPVFCRAHCFSVFFLQITIWRRQKLLSPCWRGEGLCWKANDCVFVYRWKTFPNWQGKFLAWR